MLYCGELRSLLIGSTATSVVEVGLKSRVVVAGDTFRGDQASNILALYKAFAPIFNHLNIHVELYATELNNNVIIQDWLPRWERSLQVGEVDARLAFLDDASVLGFELPDHVLDTLNKRGVPWVNLAVHPIRFLDDLYLDVNTSFKYNIEEHSASEALIKYCASLQFPNAQKRTRCTQQAGRALTIFGQTPFDKSVYFDSQFRLLDSYFAELDKLANDYDRIYYRPHPHLSDENVDALVLARYGAELAAQRDLYPWMASGDITEACAISSSVLTEAPYFGVDAFYLEPRARRFGPPISYRSLVDDISFWAKFTGVEDCGNSALGLSKIVPENYLREQFSSWSFQTPQDKLAQQVSLLERDCLAALEKNDCASSQISKLQRGLDELSVTVRQLEGAYNETKLTMLELGDRLAISEKRAREAEKELAYSSEMLSSVLSSRTWRYTEPVRDIWVLIAKIYSWGLVRMKRLLSPLVQFSIVSVLSSPKIRPSVHRCVRRFPVLYTHLRLFYRKRRFSKMLAEEPFQSSVLFSDSVSVRDRSGGDLKNNVHNCTDVKFYFFTSSMAARIRKKIKLEQIGSGL